MNITADAVETFLGLATCAALIGGAIYAVAKNNPGVDGFEWASDGLTWRRRVNPPQEQRHEGLDAE